jgi:hypothetical protein
MQPAAASPAAAAATAPSPVAPVPAGAPAKSGGLLKILLIVAGVFVLLGGIALVGVVYTGYRVAKTVKNTAKERGVDLEALTSSNTFTGRLPDPCSLISTSEASDILGVKVVSSERNGDKCEYRTETSTPEEQQEKIARAMKEMEAKGDAEKDPTKALENVAKAMGGAMAGGAGGFSIELNRDGKQALNAMRVALGMIGGGKETSKRVPELGDDAEMGPLGSMLVFTRRGIGVSIDGRMIGGQDKLIAMAQKVAARI